MGEGWEGGDHLQGSSLAHQHRHCKHTSIFQVSHRVKLYLNLFSILFVAVASRTFSVNFKLAVLINYNSGRLFLLDEFQSQTGAAAVIVL